MFFHMFQYYWFNAVKIVKRSESPITELQSTDGCLAFLHICSDLLNATVSSWSQPSTGQVVSKTQYLFPPNQNNNSSIVGRASRVQTMRRHIIFCSGLRSSLYRFIIQKQISLHFMVDRRHTKEKSQLWSGMGPNAKAEHLPKFQYEVGHNPSLDEPIFLNFNKIFFPPFKKREVAYKRGPCKKIPWTFRF